MRLARAGGGLTGTICCDINSQLTGGCKCYADASGSCAKCNGSLELTCLCSDGTTVTKGQYCPGSRIPCNPIGTGSGCTTDADCTDLCGGDLGWTADSTGYQKCTGAQKCFSGTCRSATKYRCAAGYYGTPTTDLLGNLSGGCTICPSSGGVAGSSTPGDNAEITKCFIPSGTTFSDASGSGTYDGNCYYQN